MKKMFEIDLEFMQISSAYISIRQFDMPEMNENNLNLVSKISLID